MGYYELKDFRDNILIRCEGGALEALLEGRFWDVRVVPVSRKFDNIEIGKLMERNKALGDEIYKLQSFKDAMISRCDEEAYENVKRGNFGLVRVIGARFSTRESELEYQNKVLKADVEAQKAYIEELKAYIKAKEECVEGQEEPTETEDEQSEYTLQEKLKAIDTGLKNWSKLARENIDKIIGTKEG